MYHFRKKDHFHTETHSAGDRVDSLAWVKLRTSRVKTRSHLKLCEDKTFHCTQNTANQKAAINLPCSGSDYYLIETHDILGCTARIDRGKDGFLGEREELEERGAGWRYCKISNGDNNGDLEGSMHYKALVEDLPSTEGSPHEGLLSLPTEGSMGGQQGGR